MAFAALNFVSEEATQVMPEAVPSIDRAIREPIELVAYDPAWPEAFFAERSRLLACFPSELLAVEHIESTAVPGMQAKPIVDVLAGVESMAVADVLFEPILANGYTTSRAFNEMLPDRRWFMRSCGSLAGSAPTICMWCCSMARSGAVISSSGIGYSIHIVIALVFGMLVPTNRTCIQSAEFRLKSGKTTNVFAFRHCTTHPMRLAALWKRKKSGPTSLWQERLTLASASGRDLPLFALAGSVQVGCVST